MKRMLCLLTVVMSLLACNNNRTESVPVATKSDSTSVESKESRNKKVAMAAIDAVNAHNFDGVIQTMAPGSTDYGDGSTPPVNNPDTIKASMIEGEWSGTFKKDLGKLKANGKSFKIKDCDIFKFNDEGKITEHRYIQPSSAIFTQLGIKPTK
jgi:hypothetical protein